MKKNNLRLIDANLNRLREGIRVVEDIFRYIYDDKITASKLKELRHQSRIDNYKDLLQSRDIKNDVLKKSTNSEQNRKNLESILIANFKRAQESARVLEEFCKLTSSKDSENFKYIRYELYDLEIVLTNITSNSK
ncbi:thiamine-phosphate pyrophosphorylase [Malaciobacter canalis]|jgi:thiamine-phosphate pyrophosphorylase|uniref:Thiamine-phosphate pyrophosphorylase n=1 Tax=Malaciobacter canalis TaxID=1912871 RepID=A0ABX4LN46_9BACT|nr:thiamine-phosphate pyrophosphorylase [Malaciobacter canalis]PHO09304.1 thiamine-phosphate pyrophosphorylase [Malaciobacter canalis]QEE34175.1 thiamine-phosphate pyrophosphorylase [Malaciobacter canalis]